MGASWAEIGWPGRERFLINRLGTLEPFSQYPFFYDERVELSTHREEILSSFRLEPHGPDVFFQERIQLFYHNDLLYFSEKLGDQISGQRPDHSQFEVGIIWEDLLCVLI